ncbi:MULTISPECIES: hypothetical protein [Bacillus]|uniref:hypothetical protein n=1 Tax=Bacillus TaxID=1386 RepID=UPI00071788C4|nr:hypothetical protein [Bacillus pumilus]AMM99091.1 hypothetical protein UP12_17775 [Bacillus pumilus]KRU17640.1 hypothetical protein AS142_01425 [Bacillus pumilus]MCY7678752.1 hypothetical protein [Bacillus pumilus]MCY9672478.1 hypothetical protein [Bacillus pumilus]MDH3149559.1 hypothetical protein [Bacillus pumilus]
MLILLWIVSCFTAFFLTITLVYFFTLLYAKHPRPFHQACELTVYVSFIYPLSLLVTASFIFIMMLLFPLYWLRGR